MNRAGSAGARNDKRAIREIVAREKFGDAVDMAADDGLPTELVA
jgi:hypothetical protein